MNARTPARSCVHRHRRAPLHVFRHRNPTRAARRPGTTPPSTGPLRRLHPLRQGHRSAQSAPARSRGQPDLVGGSRAGLGTDRAWTQRLALTGHLARTWEPKRLRLRVFSSAGRLVRGGRRLRLRLNNRWPWTDLITTAVTGCRCCPHPDQEQAVPSTPGKETPGPVERRPPDATAGPDE